MWRWAGRVTRLLPFTARRLAGTQPIAHGTLVQQRAARRVSVAWRGVRAESRADTADARTKNPSIRKRTRRYWSVRKCTWTFIARRARCRRITHRPRTVTTARCGERRRRRAGRQPNGLGGQTTATYGRQGCPLHESVADSNPRSRTISRDGVSRSPPPSRVYCRVQAAALARPVRPRPMA